MQTLGLVDLSSLRISLAINLLLEMCYISTVLQLGQLISVSSCTAPYVGDYVDNEAVKVAEIYKSSTTFCTINLVIQQFGGLFPNKINNVK